MTYETIRNDRETYEISEGIDGKGNRVYLVNVEWTMEIRPDETIARRGQHTHRFTSLEEAKLWARYTADA